ncbi:MAG: hypothetical protein KA765_09890 [Thermoflexales bacterium]|nr:hypothetical protein [Thermoflexales bacterium]
MKPKIYRDIVDRLVHECQQGQGQIGPRRVKAGLWNQNAREDCIPDQHKINFLLSELSVEQREILARMLESEFVSGVFETLKALEDYRIEPFLEGYEGSSYHDFIGRLDNWEWPEKNGKSGSET